MLDNPYLPPTAETDVPDAPQSHGWMVKDDFLYVEPNAQLPMVDLFTGETADRMILHSMKVTRNPFWLMNLIWTAVGFTIVSFAIGSTPLVGFVAVTAPLAFVSGLAAAIGGILTRSFTLKALFTRGSSQKITFLSRFGTILGFILLLLFFAQFQFGDSRSADPQRLLGIAFLIALIVRIVMPFFFKKLICRRSMGSHLEIRGVHPVALERLRGLRQG